MPSQRFVFVFHLIGRESGTRFSNQSRCEVKKNISFPHYLTFNTRLKTALWEILSCVSRSNKTGRV